MSDSMQRARSAYHELLDPEAPQIAWGWPTPDPGAVWELMQRLTCPIVCVGHVNETGWHQECQRRAQCAMTALGFEAPDIDPIPKDSDRR